MTDKQDEPMPAVHGISGFCSAAQPCEEACMRTMLHFRNHDGGYFHSHPLHGTVSLITTLVMAILVVLLLVMSAK